MMASYMWPSSFRSSGGNSPASQKCVTKAGAAASAEPPNPGGIEKWVVPASRNRSEELVIVGVGGGGRARRHIELTQNVADVAVDGSLTQAQFIGNLFVGATARNQTQHLALAP